MFISLLTGVQFRTPRCSIERRTLTKADIVVVISLV